MLHGMKKRSAHQTPRRKKGLFKGFGDTDQHILGQRNAFIGIKLNRTQIFADIHK
jgi:hypothetical protein